MPIAELCVQVLKCLHMVHTSEERILYSTLQHDKKIRTKERCVCVCIFSHMRAKSILTDNERNQDYIEDKKILSPNQTESSVEDKRIFHTRNIQ